MHYSLSEEHRARLSELAKERHARRKKLSLEGCGGSCISVDDAKRKFGVSTATILLWLKSGVIKGHKATPRRVKYSREKKRGLQHVYADSIPEPVPCPRCKGSGWLRNAAFYVRKFADAEAREKANEEV